MSYIAWIYAGMSDITRKSHNVATCTLCTRLLEKCKKSRRNICLLQIEQQKKVRRNWTCRCQSLSSKTPHTLPLPASCPRLLGPTCRTVFNQHDTGKGKGLGASLQAKSHQSLRRSMGNEWQTVQGPKSKAKQRASKASDRQNSTNENGTVADKRATDPAGAVLAQIDADWNHARSLGSKPTPPSANGIGAFDKLEVYSSQLLPSDLIRLIAGYCPTMDRSADKS